ncbi:MAG TPA: TauD/TfdA family dioxygenase, partial [Hyphomicrobiaceae bacterium]|nr:TauD/TfdA family dioxygenase [Hyphomicrobiaceae bacterium]
MTAKNQISIEPSGETLGATVYGIDIAEPLSDARYAKVLKALGTYGVLRFPDQNLTPLAQKSFAERFGTLEINVAAGPYTEPGLPEMMILSNIKRNGKPIGLGDAGQGWHTDMSYSREIAFANVLFALEIPHRNGKPLGSTQFANMHAAYDTLPGTLKVRLEGASAIHDFEKFWEMMRSRPGSTRGPLTEKQRADKPPVSHPVFLTHPITRRKVLYCNPGYAVRLEGFPEKESEEILAILFEHQLQEKFIYTHNWRKADLLVWENIGTLHNALADYGPDEHRLIRRCQVMADKVLAPDFKIPD